MTFLDIQVLPLTGGANRLLGVSLMFNDVSRFRRLSDDLEATKGQLETAYEELQSTNEELETTNEELQSTNDELHVINQELQARTGQISSLNHFMESVLSSLTAAVVVVSPELTARTWNRQAYQLWGLREEEALGQHLLNLDIGLPTDELRTVAREVAGGDRERAELTLQAVDRRGRAVSLRVTVTTLAGTGPDRAGNDGALLLMESASRLAEPEPAAG